MRHRDARRERFAQEYLKDLNAKDAALRSGYSPKAAKQTGHKLLSEPSVAARITELKAARAERVNVTVDWVLEQLVTNVREARIANDFVASNRACELLGKHLAMFPDKLTVDFRDVATLTDAEIEERRRQLRIVA